MIAEPLTAVLLDALAGAADIWIQYDARHAPPAQTERAIRSRRARLRAQIFALLQELPDDMTVAELRDALGPDGKIAQEDDDA